MKREIAFALFMPLTLITLAYSQVAGPADSIGSEFSATARNGWSTPSTHMYRSSGRPEADTVRIANQVLLETSGSVFTSSATNGGLWLSGDVADAFDRLCWIVGPENCHLLNLGSDSRVTINAADLAIAASVDKAIFGDTALLLANYISANEGLTLLLQILKSPHRYLLHIGIKAPTADGDVKTESARNLDNNFDSRINPLRSKGLKLRIERPPEGFDSLVAINPTVSWLNLRTRLIVPPGSTTFHELAEAHAKVELGFDYLRQGPFPGAHDIAIEREERLMAQRPFSNVVVTRGENLILKMERNASCLKKLKNNR